MAENNRCLERGCSASCCKGSYFNIAHPVNKILEWFPNAIKVGMYELSEMQSTGVFYEITSSGDARLRMVGICPNLTKDNNCRIYDSRPPDCSNLEVGSRSCYQFQEHDAKRASIFVRSRDIFVAPR